MPDLLWSTSFMQEAANFDDSLFAPTDAILQGETAIGPIDPLFRKVYSLMRYYRREADQARLDANYSSSAESLISRFIEMSARANVLSNWFWFAVREQFGLWGSSDNLALRGNWMLVRCPRPSLEG